MSLSPKQSLTGLSKKERNLNLILCLLVLGVGWFYYFSQFLSFEKPARDALKATAGLLFVACCLVNLLLTRGMTATKSIRRYQQLLFLGQVFACAGDIVLNFDFAGGAALFAVGHILFFAAFCALRRPGLRDLLLATLIVAGSVCFLTFYPRFALGDMAVIVYAYAVIISCMLAKAVSLAMTSTLDKRFRTIVLLGTLLFYLSDLMLVIHMFGDGGKLFDFLCLLLYYPAECFLALSVLAGRRLSSGDKRL